MNDDDQLKDNNNDNAIKYLKSNKDNILDLAEKHYQNLVEALTNNSIANASSDVKLSLQVIIYILKSMNQNDTLE